MRRAHVAPGFSPAIFSERAARKPAGLKAGATWLILALAALAVCAPAAQAQGTRKDDMVLNARGTPQAGANVAVCLPGANTAVTPCAPRANIYSDAALTQAKPNPITTDGLGNYFFYATPGKYTLQIYGPGITTKVIPDVIVPIDPMAPAFSSITASGGISAFSLSLSGNLTVNGSAAVTLGLTAPAVTMANQSVAPSTPPTGNVVMYAKPDRKLYFKDDTGVEQPVGGAGANAALKPANADAVCYASPSGDDANDGLSMGSAKQHVYNCLTALPGGSASAPATTGKGTVDFADGTTYGGPATGGGFWVMGASDPNYASQPTGWMRISGPVNFIGYGCKNAPQIGTQSQCQAPWGSGVDANHPAIWLSGVRQTMGFANLAIQYPGVAVRAGKCSDGTVPADGSCGTSSIRFLNVSANLNQIAGNGPTFDIGSGVYWFYLDYVSLLANASASATLTDDVRQAIVVNPGASGASSSITVTNSEVRSGGIKYSPGASTWWMTVRNLEVEGDFSNPQGPPVWLTSVPKTGVATLSGIFVADAPNTPCVRVDNAAGNPGDNIFISGLMGCTASDGSSVVGPGIVLARDTSNFSTLTAGPAQQRQAGLVAGWGASTGALPRIYGQTDAHRWAFAPTNARFTNLAKFAFTAWTSDSGGVQSIAATTAPDGTSNAAHVTSSSAAARYDMTGSSSGGGLSTTLAVGDVVIAGVWMRNPGTPQQFPAQVNFSSCTIAWDTTASGNLFLGIPYKGDSQWTWAYAVGKVASVSNNPCYVRFSATVDSSHPGDYFAPVLIRLAAGAFSVNEAYEYAMNIAPWGEACTTGDVCTLPGESFEFGGSTTFYGRLTHANTAKRTYTFKDADGTVAFTSDLPSSGAARRTCMIVLGSDNGAAALANADISPQRGQCFIPAAATVVEITVRADAGTPSVIVSKNHAGTQTALLASALATAASGGLACSNTGGTAGLDGATTCSATLQNTSLAAGDWIDLTGGTAGGTAKRLSIAITFTVN